MLLRAISNIEHHVNREMARSVFYASPRSGA
jgi:hypothetical protein